MISPRVDIADEAQVTQVVLSALRESSPRGDSGGGVWQRAGTLRVVRREPVSTGRGKLMPLDSRRPSSNLASHEKASK